MFYDESVNPWLLGSILFPETMTEQREWIKSFSPLLALPAIPGNQVYQRQAARTRMKRQNEGATLVKPIESLQTQRPDILYREYPAQGPSETTIVERLAETLPGPGIFGQRQMRAR